MSFSKMSEIEKLDSEACEKEIIRVSQELVNLRVKKATRQEFKPHEFKHNKIRLAQLLTLKSKSEIKQLTS
jgi:large subunit ribosomal protein L29